MFGRQQPPALPTQPTAADRAQILGGGLVQLIITKGDPLEFFLFLNERYVPKEEVESLLVHLQVGTSPLSRDEVQAGLTRYVNTVAGDRVKQHHDLFPSTVEVVAKGRRISITCQEAGSLEGAWIELGLKPDGTGSQLTGVQSLQILLGEGLLHGRLTWMDGGVEDLFPDA